MPGQKCSHFVSAINRSRYGSKYASAFQATLHPYPSSASAKRAGSQGIPPRENRRRAIAFPAIPRIHNAATAYIPSIRRLIVHGLVDPNAQGARISNPRRSHRPTSWKARVPASMLRNLMLNLRQTNLVGAGMQVQFLPSQNSPRMAKSPIDKPFPMLKISTTSPGVTFSRRIRRWVPPSGGSFCE